MNCPACNGERGAASWDALEPSWNPCPECEGTGQMWPTLGSSSVPKLLGLAPASWGGPWDLWARATGLETAATADTTQTRRGRILEPAILDYVAQERSWLVRRGPSLAETPILGPERWMSARPDGLRFASYADFRDRSPIQACIEVKAPRTFDDELWGPDGSDDVPGYYWAQAAWQRICTGAAESWLIAYAQMTDDLRVYHLVRDEELERELVATCRRWWERHVIGGEPPPVDGTDACSKALALRLQERVPAQKVVREASPAERSLLRHAVLLRAQRTELEAELDRVENALRAAIGTDHGLQLGGHTAATWGTRKGASRIDAEGLRKAHPDIAAAFTRTGEPGRTFRLHLTPEDLP